VLLPPPSAAKTLLDARNWESVMAKYEFDCTSQFVVTVARGGAEVSRRLVSAYGPQEAIDEAVVALACDDDIDLFEETVQFRAEKA